MISSPYLGMGYDYGKLSLNEVYSVSVKGSSWTSGYEWRWESGLAIILGGGFSHLTAVHATNGIGCQLQGRNVARPRGRAALHVL